MGNIFIIATSVYESFFEYETPKMLNIRNKKVGIFNRAVQFAIFLYIIGSLVYEKSYQEIDSIISTTNTKMKGVAYTNVTNTTIPAFEQYNRIFDVADYVVPSQEANALFVMTNFIVTPNQTRGICDEDVEFKQARCKNDSDCPRGVVIPNGNGIRTGRCIPTSRPNRKFKVCEIWGWCPVENDEMIEDRPLLQDSKEFTLLIKNYVDFPKFKIKRKNLLESQSKEFLRSCRFNASDPDHRLCPIFRLHTIVEEAGADYDKLALKGGVIIITIQWMCDFDKAVDDCRPAYSFRQLDENDTRLSSGWNFRYAHYYSTVDGVDYRTLVKAYGLRFIIEVVGEGRKFHIIPLLVTIGSGVGLLAIAGIVSDFVVFHLLTHRTQYKEHQVDVVDVCALSSARADDFDAGAEKHYFDAGAEKHYYNHNGSDRNLSPTRVSSTSERRPFKLTKLAKGWNDLRKKQYAMPGSGNGSV